MKKIYKDRLLKLAKFLREEVPDSEFDLSCYVTWNADLPESKDGRAHMAHNCGETACALGWATCLWPDNFWFTGNGTVRDLRWNISPQGFFDIDYQEWDYLFGPDHERTPKQEAKIIERFARNRKK